MMRRINRTVARLRDDSGAMTVIVAICMTVILGMAALVIDVGVGQARKAQLQDAADAAALGVAQRCFDSTATTIASCDPSVMANATSIAALYAEENVNGGGGAVSFVGFGTTGTGIDRVGNFEVDLTMEQPSFFARIFDVDYLEISASATAQWGQKATPLPLAYNKCAMPTPDETSVQFLRFDLLDLHFGSCGLIGGVTDVLSAGWLTPTNLLGVQIGGTEGLAVDLLNPTECTYDIGLIGYVGSIANQAVPINCQSEVASLVGKQVLLPVYDGVLKDVVINGVLMQKREIKEYALVEVTGFDFQTISAGVNSPILNTVQGLNAPLTSLSQLVNGVLQVPNLLALQTTINGPGGQVGSKSFPTGGPQCPNLIDLNVVNLITAKVEYPLCQGIQGRFVDYLTPEEAAQRMVGVALIE